jgi:hypothetical protein
MIIKCRCRHTGDKYKFTFPTDIAPLRIKLEKSVAELPN